MCCKDRILVSRLGQSFVCHNSFSQALLLLYLWVAWFKQLWRMKSIFVPVLNIDTPKVSARYPMPLMPRYFWNSHGRLAGFGTSWWKHRCSWVCFPIFRLETDYPWLIIVSFAKVGIMNEMPRAGRFPPQLAASLFCSRKPVPLVLDPWGIARRDKIPKKGMWYICTSF